MHSIPWVNCRRSFTRDLFWYSGYKSTYTIHYIDFTLLSTVIVRLKQEFAFLLSDAQRYFRLWRLYFTILLLVLKDLPHQLYVYNTEFLLPMNHFCQIWFPLLEKLCSWRLKCQKVNNDRRLMILKVHSNFIFSQTTSQWWKNFNIAIIWGWNGGTFSFYFKKLTLNNILRGCTYDKHILAIIVFTI